MAEEEKTPENVSDETIEEIAHSVPAPDEYPEGQAEAVKEQSGDDADAVEEVTIAALEATEAAQDNPVVQAFGAVVDAVQDAINRTDEDHSDSHKHHGDTTIFLGKEYDIPVYTSVFIALGVFTVLEVAIAEIITSNAKIPLLLGFAIAKALLVVLFYMHLRDDSRIFALALALPVAIGLLSALFLIAVPAGY